MNDSFSLFHRENLTLEGLSRLYEWDLFVAAHNLSERVEVLYENVPSRLKRRLVFPEYGLTDLEMTDSEMGMVHGSDEAESVVQFCNHLELEKYKPGGLCVDITGFIRPYLLFLLLWFHVQGFRRVDFLYAEPSIYLDKEETQFVSQEVVEVRAVLGFEGSHKPNNTRQDILLIGAGYDHHLISAVASFKPDARKQVMFGFPALRPEMYQESLLRADWASEALGFSEREAARRCLAPASDPFETANVLCEELQIDIEEGTNIYLSSMGPKPQVLGFGLFYISKLREQNSSSMIFPFASRHQLATCKGYSKLWFYRVDFELLTALV